MKTSTAISPSVPSVTELRGLSVSGIAELLELGPIESVMAVEHEAERALTLELSWAPRVSFSHRAHATQLALELLERWIWTGWTVRLVEARAPGAGWRLDRP